jgi:hypothetical protein
MSACLVILTVGTGTAGKFSHLEQGLINTLRALRPRAYWLVPSASPDSIAVAEIVREGLNAEMPSAFSPWSAEVPCKPIALHDSLEDCRATVREVIRRAAGELRAGERLLVNPTSGTKQMSAGATLAALDEGVGEIVFTVGERADGVVKTGTERIETFDASWYFADRDLALARELFAAGSHLAAARILEKHRACDSLAAAARSVHEWCRLNYSGAATEAETANVPWRTHLRALAQKGGAPSPLLVADLLDATRFAHGIGDPEWALSLGYKTLEAAIQFRVLEDLKLAPPYHRSDLLLAGPPAWLGKKICNMAGEDDVVRLGFRDLAELLRHSREPLAVALLKDQTLMRSVDARNEVTHALRTVSGAHVQGMINHATALFRSYLPLPKITARPNVLRAP